MHDDSTSRRPAQTRYMLARAWHSKGAIAAAIADYRKTLALEPGHLEASILLGSTLESQRRLDEAAQVYRQALEHNPNDARIHKQFINVSLLLDGPDAVFRHYRLARQDSKYLSLRPSEILCCIVVRNELPRLPYFLEYYRQKGIDAFLAVDNGSSDGSFEYLLQQPDVYLWQSDLSFNRANFGAGWFEPILRMHGQNHWCLIVDADELLYYPECERRSIADLCLRLEAQGKSAFQAVHLDMYSELPVKDTHYTPGRPFQEVCPYFDRNFYHECHVHLGPLHSQKAYFGGVRQRVFGEAGCYLSKVPLIKYDEKCVLAGGQHWTSLPREQIAIESGCLLHFKFFSSFCESVSQEAARKEHYNDAERYQRYEWGLRQQPALALYDPAHSVKLEDSRQLVRFGVMQVDPGADDSAEAEFPRIDAVPSEDRPFWSVMLTVYRRTQYLEQALRSVLVQSPGPEEMQIEVVSDGPGDSTVSEIAAIVRSVGGGRVSFYPHPIRAGHPEIFNVCLRRARGLWAHLLHDDDWVAPGFYMKLNKGMLQAPDIGAAFCRHTIVDEEGRTIRMSPLERETAGKIDDWLDRIACECRLQTPSIVVRRQAYEQLGGYCRQAMSAFDWEMWQRIAVHFPVWYEPKPLAFFRKSSRSESARVIASGQQIADTRAAMQVAQRYLPRAVAAKLSRRACENYALWALELARKQIETGNFRAAMINLSEGIRCSNSEQVTQKLFSLLREQRPET